MESEEDNPLTTAGRARRRAVVRQFGAIAAAAGIALLLVAQGRLPADSENSPRNIAVARSAAAAEAPAEPSGGIAVVARVIDGDTLDVRQGGKIVRVRLLGVDSPETVDPRKPAECFGREASDFTKNLLRGKDVSLETDPSQPLLDKYGRLLAYLFLDGELFNERLIKEGFAREYTYKAPYRRQSEFRQAERRAREAGRGLWGGSTCAGRRALSR